VPALRTTAFAFLVLLLAPPAWAQLSTPPSTIPVVLLNGKLVPFSEFRFGFPDACPAFHFHAAAGAQVTALDGTVIPDPDPPACGYGILGALPVRTVLEL
jgi:hypothetical protein